MLEERKRKRRYRNGGKVKSFEAVLKFKASIQESREPE